MLKLRAISSSPIQQQSENARQSTAPKSRSGLKLVALALTGFTIGIGYAVLNPDSRRQIESYVPQSSHLFDYIDQLLGENKNLVKLEEPKTSDLKPIVPIEVKRPEQKKTEPVENISPKEKTMPKEQKVSEKEEKKDWRSAVKQLDLQEEATVNAIETKLQHCDESVKLKVAEALNSSYVAIESLNKYRLALRRALDDTQINGLDKELEWRQVTDLFDLQSADVNVANEKFLIAKNSVQELDKLLGQVKDSDDLKKNVKNLKQTQIDLINQMRNLQVEENKLNEAIAHANVLKNYTQEQKVARNQFLKEMQSLQPEGIRTQTSSDQLSNEEINSLLLHAHKRVVQLQNQLEKLQVCLFYFKILFYLT